MSLVTKDKLTGYKDSYLYQTMRSFHVNEEEPRYVLTHYVPKQKTKVDAQRAVEKIANNTQPESKPNKTKTMPSQPRTASTANTTGNWNPNSWTPSTAGPNDKNYKPEEYKPKAAKINKLPTTSHTETLPIPNTTVSEQKQRVMKNNVQEPKTEVARYRHRSGTKPVESKTPVTNGNVGTASVNPSKVADLDATKPTTPERVEAKQAIQQTKTNNLSQNSQPKKTEQVAAKKTEKTDDFINLQQVFETAEWLQAANQLRVELNAHVNQMPVKTINIIDLSDRSETYIPLDKRTLNLLYSVVIGKNKDIILIFGDGTTINIAPESWLTKNVNAKILLNNNYNYVYHDLNLVKLLQGLKPLCASEVNTPQYMQLWLKYIPFVPAKED